jgi:hypothetical protein
LLPPSTLIALLLEAASTSETSVNFYETTRRYIPEDSHIPTRRHENLKFHLLFQYFPKVFCTYFIDGRGLIVYHF